MGLEDLAVECGNQRRRLTPGASRSEYHAGSTQVGELRERDLRETLVASVSLRVDAFRCFPGWESGLSPL